MANEFAIKQAKNICSYLKDDMRRTELDISNHQKLTEKLEEHMVQVKRNINEMEKAIVILGEAQKE